MTDKFLTPCMGGWCQARESCAHYRSGRFQQPSERLCDRGYDEPTPIKEPSQHRRVPQAPVPVEGLPA